MNTEKECTLEGLAEQITSIRHECLDQGLEFGELLNLSWHWYNDDLIDRLDRKEPLE